MPHRALIAPAGRGKGRKTTATHATEDQTPAGHHAAMTWVQRLKRVFGIDIETCEACGGAMKVIACIEDPAVIKKRLAHLDQISPTTAPRSLPEPRAPPQNGLFDSL